jgi:NADH:ubiquinone oxidoreductase subunit F (NADH-binding)
VTALTASLALPGVLDGPGPDLAAHLAGYGPLPPADALEVAARAGLTGRGGAGFPMALKLRSIAAAARAAGRSPVVVANGAEGEPAAAKDAVLLRTAPHLVLDGLQLVAHGLGAETLVLAAPGGLLPGLAGALRERRGEPAVRLHRAADTFLAGEESALVSAVDGRAPLPLGTLPPIRERGVGGRPTLVANVETLARLALLARGDDEAAARTLLTRRVGVRGAAVVDVVDVALGTRLGDVLRIDDDVRAVLVGGYHGTWLPAEVARGLRLEREGLAPVGAALGAGVLAALPGERCGLRETARVVGYLAAQSAGQCGPCLNGLPRIAAALDLLARPGRVDARLLDDVARWCGLVTGRGACRHPDGSVRLVASALQVFAGEQSLHRAGRCSATDARGFLPVPGGLR